MPAVDLKNPSLKKFVSDYGWATEKVAVDTGATFCATSSTHPKLCQTLVTLHSIDHIRIYLAAAFAVFVLAKYRLDRWLSPSNGDSDLAEKQKVD